MGGQQELHHAQQKGDKVAHDAHHVALVPAVRKVAKLLKYFKN